MKTIMIIILLNSGNMLDVEFDTMALCRTAQSVIAKNYIKSQKGRTIKDAINVYCVTTESRR